MFKGGGGQLKSEMGDEGVGAGREGVSDRGRRSWERSGIN